MPLNSAPKFVNSGSHSYNSSNSNNNNNNNNGGKLLICLRDLSKIRDQTLKSPNNGGPLPELGRNKSSPSFRNSTDQYGPPKLSPDSKPLSTIIKIEDFGHHNSRPETNVHHDSDGKQHHISSSNEEHNSPGRPDPPLEVVVTDRKSSDSPKNESAEDLRRREESGRDRSPGGGVGGGGGEDSGKDGDPVKQLNKLKRFLSTLQQFANDISKEIGECVQTLIYLLVHAKISVEDFHHRLQQATNFPLRPFVVPFLKASLPLLQMELIQHSRYSPSAFQSSFVKPSKSGVGNMGTSYPAHSHFLPPQLPDLPPLLIPFTGALNLSNGSLGNGFHSDSSLPRDMDLGLCFTRGELNLNGKRTSPDLSCALSLSTSSSSSSSSSRPPIKKRRSSSPRPFVMTSSSLDTTPISLRSDLFKSQKPLELVPDCRSDVEKKLLDNSSINAMLNSAWERFEERSAQVENLLLTLLNMADKCSQKMSAIKTQTRMDFEKISSYVLNNESNDRGTNPDEYLQKLDARMKTEKVVNEVKQQAMVELQRAVAAAEAKATLVVASERMRLERVVEDARKQAKQEILDILNKQEESNENCWNCGRLASETCSGCNEARYCGPFCQHKDWESHHKVCRHAQERSVDQLQHIPAPPRSLLVPMEGISPWSVVPNFLISRNYFSSSRNHKLDKDAFNDLRRLTPPIKTEQRDTPPTTDVNSNVIGSAIYREKSQISDSSDVTNHSRHVDGPEGGVEKKKDQPMGEDKVD